MKVIRILISPKLNTCYNLPRQLDAIILMRIGYNSLLLSMILGRYCCIHLSAASCNGVLLMSSFLCSPLICPELYCDIYLTKGEKHAGDTFLLGCAFHESIVHHKRGGADGLAGIGRGSTSPRSSAAWALTRFTFSRVPVELGTRTE
ncbi:hypothetical protein FCM35_KLT03948 [Carex littledalei]|uniref:Uncharacterized protein n=1 Tax=Carex littledalei TaxID=544730 RepID=A0A833QVJ3_9POAL|nr:hypothetical protein FCM35_KLT03948 [Carex littledalei]